MLQNLPNLSAVTLQNLPNIRDITILASLTNLKVLTLDNIPINNIDALQNLRNLSLLTLLNLFNLTNIDVLSSLGNLSDLTLQNLPINSLDALDTSKQIIIKNNLEYIKNEKKLLEAYEKFNIQEGKEEICKKIDLVKTETDLLSNNRLIEVRHHISRLTLCNLPNLKNTYIPFLPDLKILRCISLPSIKSFDITHIVNLYDNIKEIYLEDMPALANDEYNYIKEVYPKDKLAAKDDKNVFKNTLFFNGLGSLSKIYVKNLPGIQTIQLRYLPSLLTATFDTMPKLVNIICESNPIPEKCNIIIYNCASYDESNRFRKKNMQIITGPQDLINSTITSYYQEKTPTANINSPRLTNNYNIKTVQQTVILDEQNAQEKNNMPPPEKNANNQMDMNIAQPQQSYPIQDVLTALQPISNNTQPLIMIQPQQIEIPHNMQNSLLFSSTPIPTPLQHEMPVPISNNTSTPEITSYNMQNPIIPIEIPNDTPDFTMDSQLQSNIPNTTTNQRSHNNTKRKKSKIISSDPANNTRKTKQRKTS